MVKKHFYSWQDVEKMCVNIVTQMYRDNWRPDYIVGLTRGGNVPATIISNMTGIRCEALKVSLRDNGDDSGCEINAWMAEDAYGYDPEGEYAPEMGQFKHNPMVDDINDTGATFNWIKKDWQSSCLSNSPVWDQIWGENVRFAVLTENLSSSFDGVSYHCDEVNKAEEDVWLVYPWENVGEY
jgi:hypoxanthine phosphoribosyltransferase